MCWLPCVLVSFQLSDYLVLSDAPELGVLSLLQSHQVLNRVNEYKMLNLRNIICLATQSLKTKSAVNFLLMLCV